MLIWALIMGGLASAQDTAAVVPEVDAHLFQMSVDSDIGFWTNDAGAKLDRFLIRGRVGAHLALRPFVVAWQPSEGTTSAVEVDTVVQVEVNQVLHFNRFRFGMDIPVLMEAYGPDGNVGAILSEIGLDGRATLVDPYRHGFGLGVGLHTGLPTLMGDRVLLGAGRRRYLQPEVVGEVQRDDLTVALNLGYRWVSGELSPGVVWGDQIAWRLGAGYSVLGGDAHLSVETGGGVLLRSPPSALGWSGLPLSSELIVGGWYRLRDNVFVEAAVGTSPLKSIAAPRVRTWVGLALHPSRASAMDSDDDGLSDEVDLCVHDAEDFDDYEDADGCPELDNDDDGIVDVDDQCPLKPEDYDEFSDADGCPDPDNDRDRIPDVDDECPNEREDRDGYQDTDGCPDPSSRVVVEVQNPGGRFMEDAQVKIRGNGLAEDGRAGQVWDLHDAVYIITASLADFRTATLEVTVDGMAEPRRFVTITIDPIRHVGRIALTVTDPGGLPVEGAVATVVNTGITGESDALGVVALADVPEGDVELEVRAPGYGVARLPAAVIFEQRTRVSVQLKPSQAVLVGSRIEIRDSVYFRTGSATIRDVSYGLLDDVAAIILDNPKAEAVQVEGHTDSRGSAPYNKDLSERRAASVRQYLVDAGVDAERLVAVGFGEELPIDPREVPEAWDLNRRVDFYILRWEGEDIDVDAEREKVRAEAMSGGAEQAAIGSSVVIEVYDADGERLPGAVVRLVGEGVELEGVAYDTFDTLTAGTYACSASLDGYGATERTVEVDGSATDERAVRLTLLPSP